MGCRAEMEDVLLQPAAFPWTFPDHSFIYAAKMIRFELARRVFLLTPKHKHVIRRSDTWNHGGTAPTVRNPPNIHLALGKRCIFQCDRKSCISPDPNIILCFPFTAKTELETQEDQLADIQKM